MKLKEKISEKVCEYCQIDCFDLNDEEFADHIDDCANYCFDERIASQF